MFCASASATSARSRSSLKATSQLFSTAPAAPPAAQAGGSFALASPVSRSSARSGGDFNAQPARPRARSVATTRRMASVQLRNQVVDVRADAQDHLAEDVDRRQVLGIDGGVARGAGRHEDVLVALRD